MDIQHTFDIYKKQLAILQRGNYLGRPQILRQYRMQFKEFTGSDIAVLKEYLLDKEKKWFVAWLLDNLDNFSTELLKPMLSAAINEPDPSLNNEFVKPCRRVFAYEDMLLVLLDLFYEGGTTEKIGVLNAFYWARPTVYIQHSKSWAGQANKQKGYVSYFWDYERNSFNEIFVEDEILFEKDSPGQIVVHNKLLACFRDTFDHTDDPELKQQLARYFPDSTTTPSRGFRAKVTALLLGKRQL